MQTGSSVGLMLGYCSNVDTEDGKQCIYVRFNWHHKARRPAGATLLGQVGLQLSKLHQASSTADSKT